jgi:hypothetical protein
VTDYATFLCISSPYASSEYSSKHTPLTDVQRKERAASNSLRQAQISEAVEAWKQSTLNTAADLANRFDKKERYFLDLLFQAGTHLVHQHKKVNAHNAYLHMKAEEMRDRKCSTI